ncbi:uncharacterized protein LOC121650850 isoform X2 [Melanotaenia boesemani]|uniref:uncharacterized protein LOC121650850 isoform X2 n=1 Tax=Melanotaenia boesemani TaxID=1250792 RepID=UPI001C050A30|nr:uncharacterized protein LOC121650850 isoform X2 [Melanotaenia boesemani]XP_041858544.1 uncharacterized protein LOC121650850 isoform X2 [Melanotaenia boesemani]
MLTDTSETCRCCEETAAPCTIGMASRKRRKAPSKDAAEHVSQGIDKKAHLEVKFINPFKGRGVFANTQFQKGDFVVEYRGELISSAESQRRRRIYHSKCTVFMFDFYWKDKWWCIDASQEDDSLGRLVNDDHKNPNCKIKKILTDCKPHLCLFALRDIDPGEEITYDYGGTEWPWRQEVDNQSNVPASVEAEVPGRSDRAPEEASLSTKRVDNQSNVPASVEAEVPGRSDQAPEEASLSTKRVDNQSNVPASVEAEVPGRSDQAPEEASLSTKRVDNQSNVPASVEAEVPGRSDQAPEEASLSTKRVDNQSNVPASVEAEVPGRSDQAPEEASLSTKRVDNQSNVPASVEAEVPGRSDQAPEEASLSTKRRFLPHPYDSTSSDQEEFVPRLRRTKSIQMKNVIDFESDELFDPCTSGSGEEYVPESCEDSSDFDDNNDILEITNERHAKLKRLIEIAHSEHGLFSTAEDNSYNSTSAQSPNRGRSPTKEKHSCPKSKRRRPNSLPSRTCTRGALSSEQSGTSNTEDHSINSATVLKDSSDKSTTIVTEDVASPTLFMPAVQKKDNGSRKYNKKQYCLFCKKGFIKIARHLERAHHSKPEVAQAMALPKGSKERRLHLEHLRNRGNFAHNVEVLDTGTGNLVPRKLPQEDSKVQDFLHCIYCQGFFRKKILWRHMSICKFKPGTSKKPGKTRVQALCAFAVPPPPDVSTEFWKMLNCMLQDEVYSAVKSDSLIMEYGEHLFNRLGYDVAKHEYIRQKMRELGRLLICSRGMTPLKTMKDHVLPGNFMHVIDSVRQLAGYVNETKTFKCPSLALKIGHNLNKVSQLVESRANVQMNYSEAKSAHAFRKVYEARWNEFISAASLRTLREAKWNAPQLLPFTQDVQTLQSYLEVQQQHCYSELSTETSPQTWANLAKVTLAQVILFNRRRAGEVSKIPLSAYLSSNASHGPDDVNDALSELEKKLCKHFRRIEIRGKRERKVPVLLTPTMQQSLDRLVSKRQECGVPESNTYLFARPSAWTCYRGSDCLQHFASVCGAKNPENLTSTRLRKQTGTLSQVLNLSNTELDQLADFLGHDIRVHRQFYRLPEGTLQLAKISKVLLAMERGRLAEFKGKSLDDICIDPDEHVHVDSDAEDGYQSDTQEKAVTSTEMETKMTAIPDVEHMDVERCETEQGDMMPSQSSEFKSQGKNKVLYDLQKGWSPKCMVWSWVLTM